MVFCHFFSQKTAFLKVHFIYQWIKNNFSLQPEFNNNEEDKHSKSFGAIGDSSAPKPSISSGETSVTTTNVQDEVKESINEDIEKILDNPNENPQANIPLLKKAQELFKEYEDCEVKYYCNVCPDFSTLDPCTLIEHHCSLHEIVDAEKFPGNFSKLSM